MPINDYPSYVSKLRAPYQRVEYSKVSLAASAGRLSSLWVLANLGGAAPGAAAVPTNATAGALEIVNSLTTQRIIASENASAIWMPFTLADRLSHQSGLSGTAAGAQVTNLPTAALTRYTTGDQVFIGLEIYTALGATPQTVTASYTNQAGVAGRTTVAAVIGGTAFNEVGRFIVLNLQAGDTGVRAVASVTLSGTTGTAGNFGVTLFRPLWTQSIQQEDENDGLLDLANLPEVVSNACLFGLITVPSTATGIIEKSFSLAEDD